MAIDVTEREPSELVTLPPNGALEVFTLPGGIEPYFEKIRAVIDQFEPDLSTAAGRKQIGSLAWRVSRSKTYLAAEAKRLIEEQEKIPKAIRATLKHIETKLDSWRDEIRAPLDAWEQAEDNRKAKHKTELARISRLGDCSGKSAADIRQAIATLEALVLDERTEEFKADYHQAKLSALKAAQGMLTIREQWEKDQAELARLRAEEVKRKQEESARLAAERAQQATEAKSAPIPTPAPAPPAPPASRLKAALAAAVAESDDDELPLPAPTAKVAPHPAHAALVAAGIPAIYAAQMLELVRAGRIPGVRLDA